jgi:hypothetical protein
MFRAGTWGDGTVTTAKTHGPNVLDGMRQCGRDASSQTHGIWIATAITASHLISTYRVEVRGRLLGALDCTGGPHIASPRRSSRYCHPTVNEVDAITCTGRHTRNTAVPLQCNQPSHRSECLIWRAMFRVSIEERALSRVHLSAPPARAGAFALPPASLARSGLQYSDAECAASHRSGSNTKGFDLDRVALSVGIRPSTSTL